MDVAYMYLLPLWAEVIPTEIQRMHLGPWPLHPEGDGQRPKAPAAASGRTSWLSWLQTLHRVAWRASR